MSYNSSHLFLLLVSLFSVFLSHARATYILTDDYSTDTFWGNFTPFTGPDPTNGFVEFMNYDAAAERKLIGSTSNFGSAAYLTVDSTTKYTANGGGRPSMRIASTKRFNHGLFILDLSHMPSSVCGSWPAFWLLGSGVWPAGGEIDIIEGVHTNDINQMTAHTSPGCSVNSSGFSGVVNNTDCGPDVSNTGCGIKDQKDSNSFGSGLNDVGGGVYATEWTSQAISIWYFSRTAIPADIVNGSPDPDTWGIPVARFAGSSCPIDQHFRDMQIIFDTTFCGDWAGKNWASSGCQKSTGTATCQEYVAENPRAFKDSFWLVNSVRVYTETGH